MMVMMTNRRSTWGKTFGHETGEFCRYLYKISNRQTFGLLKNRMDTAPKLTYSPKPSLPCVGCHNIVRELGIDGPCGAVTSLYACMRGIYS